MPQAVTRGLAVLVLFTLLAGDFWRNLIGWPGYLVVAGLLVACCVFSLVRSWRPQSWRRLPWPLALFVLVAAASIMWSAYPGASALGVTGQLATTVAGVFLALGVDARQLLDALSCAVRAVLGLSVVFELVVAALVRHPLFPLWAEYSNAPHPAAFYWSRGLILHGGPIQGIQGNSNLLGMVALLALIVTGIQLARQPAKRWWLIGWLVVAVAVLFLTRSATVTLAGVVTAIVLGVALWARKPRQRRAAYLTFAAFAGVSLAAGAAFWSSILRFLGKSADLTGRVTIWQDVIGVAEQRPAFGWGWVSYWAPWVEPFRNLAVRGGVEYLQAHNAWLDVWLQIGILGLVPFVALVGMTIRRSWSGAIGAGPDAASLLPLLLMAAMLAQSLTESRMLIEAGWALLVALSVLRMPEKSSVPQDPELSIPTTRPPWPRREPRTAPY